jgi:hypothetical protein
MQQGVGSRVAGIGRFAEKLGLVDYPVDGDRLPPLQRCLS